MSAMRGLLIAVLLAAGCAAPSKLVASLPTHDAYLCKHCNCFMPAGIDPEALCPVCDCGRKAYECVRGR